MKIPCDKCGRLLKKPGGLLFSPPDNDSSVVKYHLCCNCYAEVWSLIFPFPCRNDLPKKKV